MGFKTTTWILVAGLVAVAAYFFLVDEKRRAERVAERSASAHIFPYASADVERFVLVNPKGERIEVARSGSGWELVSPIEAPGSGPEISSFVDQIVPGHTSAQIDNVSRFADYGLEKPFATLIIYHSGGSAPDTLLVGDKTPAGPNCYLRLGSSSRVLISSEVTRNVMNKGVFHLRDKNFLPEGSQNVDAMEIRAGSRRMRLIKERGYWWFAAPHVRANRRAIESYLTRLTDAVIHEFIREDTKDLAPYGLRSPEDVLVLGHGAGAMTISFGNKRDNDLVAAVRTGLDKVVAVEAALREPFDWNPVNLRAMNLSFVDEDSVRAFTFETPDTSVVFEKKEGSWRAVKGDTLYVRRPDVTALIRKIGAATFERIVTEPLPSAPRPGSFALRVTFAGDGGTVIDRVTISTREDGSEIGSSITANAIGSLPRGTAEGIEAVFKRIGAS
jgi:hypothetical protein